MKYVFLTSAQPGSPGFITTLCKGGQRVRDDDDGCDVKAKVRKSRSVTKYEIKNLLLKVASTGEKCKDVF